MSKPKIWASKFTSALNWKDLCINKSNPSSRDSLLATKYQLFQSTGAHETISGAPSTTFSDTNA